MIIPTSVLAEPILSRLQPTELHLSTRVTGALADNAFHTILNVAAGSGILHNFLVGESVSLINCGIYIAIDSLTVVDLDFPTLGYSTDVYGLFMKDAANVYGGLPLNLTFYSSCVVRLYNRSGENTTLTGSILYSLFA